ncbi:hypothetical protein [Niabella aquatica]
MTWTFLMVVTPNAKPLKKYYGNGSVVFETFGESSSSIVQGSFQRTLYNSKNCNVTFRNVSGSLE